MITFFAYFSFHLLIMSIEFVETNGKIRAYMNEKWQKAPLYEKNFDDDKY